MTMMRVETSKECEDSKDRTILRYQTLIILHWKIWVSLGGSPLCYYLSEAAQVLPY